MKYLLLFALIIAVASAQGIHSDEEKATMKQYTKECRESTNVDKDMITKMRQGEFMEDQRLKEYLFCFYKKMDWQREDGSMNKDNLRRYMASNSDATDAMNQCMERGTGRDGPEAAFQFHRCFKKALPTELQSSF